MSIYELHREDGYLLSTDPSRLDIAAIHEWLSVQSYWAQGRPLAVLEKAIANSLCFAIYSSDQQVAFARVVSDYATFGWLCDVFVSEEARGAGLGKWLVEAIFEHQEIAHLKRTMLATRDAHELYRQYGGFQAITNPEFWMLRQL